MTRRAWIAVAFALVLTAPAHGEEIEVPGGDGWYSWETAASRTGGRSCCYGWQGGQSAARETCDLDGRRGGYTIGGDCLLESDRIRVYVRMQDGRPDRVRALGTDCPVTTESEVRNMGAVDAGASVRWLAAHIENDRDADAELLAAIPMHAGPAVVPALTELLEDRGRPMETREQALFWLAQSDTDEAFDYLDRLLGQR